MSWGILLLLFFLTSFTSKFNKNNKEMSVSIVIPAFNEEKSVGDVIKISFSLPYVDEVIVVDDGSYDKTANEAKIAGATVISHANNQGKGSAIKTGFKHSKGDIIVFIDGDIKNLTPEKIDKIVEPILDGKTDITKTKFMRESGRVTELTAKPLLRFFFPEITFEQPLSGQFAGKRSTLNNIKFEKDYGVDVGIVLDADVHGIQIEEVDIGEIKHDISPLNSLHEMANEVVRTIIDRAVEYGRVTMMDSMGNYIRMAILGLSLIIMGLFTIFFVQGMPLELGVIIVIFGIGIAIYYVIKLILKSINIFKNRSKGNLLRPFLKMHFPIIISAILLLLMISTFLSAATISNGRISIEPTSRNLVIFPGSPDQTIYLRGPYTVDSAIENEVNLIRMPEDALNTLELDYEDKLFIKDQYYSINGVRSGENNILRLPSKVRTSLDVQSGNVIADGSIKSVFEGISGEHFINSSNLSTNTTVSEFFIIDSKEANSTIIDLYIDDKFIESITGAFKNNSNYDIYINGEKSKSIDLKDLKNKESYFIYSDEHVIELKINDTKSSSKYFVSSEFGRFLNFNFK